jgi:hypothetical protein
VQQNQFVVDNGTDGFDLHALDNSMYVRTLPTGIPIKKLPKQVAFGENSTVVVGGSDHGIVYVFERESGKLLHSLRHADKGMVQTVTTHEMPDKSVIIGASSSSCGSIIITLWARKHPQPHASLTGQAWSFRSVLDVIQKLVFVMGTIAFLYQTIDVSIGFFDAF